jgi:hypothetical protein
MNKLQSSTHRKDGKNEEDKNCEDFGENSFTNLNTTTCTLDKKDRSSGLGNDL